MTGKTSKRTSRRGSEREAIRDVQATGRRLRKEYRGVLMDRQARARLQRAFGLAIAPSRHRRKAGRPRLMSVDIAEKLMRDMARMHPEWNRKQLWHFIAPNAIPGYDSMDRASQRTALATLRGQYSARLRMRRGRRKKTRRSIVRPEQH